MILTRIPPCGKEKNINPRPIGEETSGLIIAEAYEMVSVINNRAQEKGKTWSDVVNQKDDNGEFQIRGNKDGPGYLKLIGSDVGLCTRLLYIKTAIAMVKQNGVFNFREQKIWQKCAL